MIDHNLLILSQCGVDGHGDVIRLDLAAVVGVHYAGTPLDEAIRTICSASNLPLIEDAAHAFGSADDRGMIAGQGTAGACFSFYATKNLTTGEGGAIATDNEALRDFALQYRLHGMSSDAVDRYSRPGAHSYDVTMPGLKANLPDLLAVLGRSQLSRFPQTQRHRRQLVERYREGLADLDLRFVPTELDGRSADHLAVVDAGSPVQRDKIIAALTSAQIGSSVHFRPLHTFTWYRDATRGPGGVPVADELDGQVASLPLHAGMSADDVDRVVDIVRGVACA